jgi:hypothetical protein
MPGGPARSTTEGELWGGGRRGGCREGSEERLCTALVARPLCSFAPRTKHSFSTGQIHAFFVGCPLLNLAESGNDPAAAGVPLVRSLPWYVDVRLVNACQTRLCVRSYRENNKSILIQRNNHASRHVTTTSISNASCRAGGR